MVLRFGNRGSSVRNIPNTPLESRVIPESQCFRYLHKKGILKVFTTVNQRVAGSSHSDNAGGSISIPLNGSMPLNVNYGINLNSGFSIGVSSRGDSSSGVNMSVKPGEAMTIGGAAILLLLTGTTSSGLILAL